MSTDVTAPGRAAEPGERTAPPRAAVHAASGHRLGAAHPRQEGPTDLRLVPPALGTWATAAVMLDAPPGWTVGVVTGGLLLAGVLLLRARGRRPARGRRHVSFVALLLCVAAAAASAALHGADLRRGPVPALARQYATVTAEVEVTADPRLTRPRVRGNRAVPPTVLIEGDVRRGLAHGLGRRHRLGAARPEVLHGEDRRDDEQHRERGHTAPLQPAPGLQPHRHALPQRLTGPVPPARRGGVGGALCRLLLASGGFPARRVALRVPPPESEIAALGCWRPLPRLAPHDGTFGEERLGAQAELLRLRVRLRVTAHASSPAAGAGTGAGRTTAARAAGRTAVAQAAVGGGATARATGRGRCA